MKPAPCLRGVSALLLGIVLATPALGAAADEPLSQPGYIKGTMTADFRTQRPENREGEYPKKEIANRFDLDLSVGYTRYQGHITCLPHIFSKHLGRLLQDGSCTFDVDLAVVNPQNPTQSRTIGKLVGAYPVDDAGLVDLGKGSLRMEVQTMGKAQGFTSAFAGRIQGKPPKKVSLLSSLTEQVKHQTRTLEKMMGGGKKVSVALGDVDPVRFVGTVLAMGPVATYPATTVDGELIYSYETDNWFPQLTLRAGSAKPDTLGGGMKWVDDSDTEGHYALNLIFNEQAEQGESAAFAEAQGEDAFFMSDSSQSVVNGRIAFRDQKVGEAVVKSDITFDLGLQNVTPIQAQALVKLLLLLPEQMWGE